MSMAAPLATHIGTPARLDRLGGGRWWRAAKHALDGASPLAVLSPASGRSMLNGRAVNDNALISRQGGIKYVVGADGVLSAVPANSLAYDWSSGVRELLLEGQATNLLRTSSGDANTERCTKTLGQSGPDKGSSAIRVTTTGETDPVATRGVIQPPSGLTITFSVWLRVNSAGGNALTARLFSYGNTGAEAAVSTDLVISTQWRRYSQTRTFPAGMTSTTFTVRVDPFDGAGGADTPLAGGSIDIDCWQVEVGPVATSYIPTSGAAVTRPTDIAPLWSVAGAATAWAWRGNVPADVSNIRLIGLRDNDAPPLLYGSYGSNGKRVAIDGAPGGIAISAVDTMPGMQGIAFGFGATGRRGSVNGASAIGDAVQVDPSLRSAMFIGGPTGLYSGQVLRLRELVAWQLPDRPSAAGCQAQARLWSA